MIIVFGSINMDMLIPVRHFAAPGETIFGGAYTTIPGGKGANQALAANRMAVKTALVSCVGDDGFGLRMVGGLRRAGVVTTGVGQSEQPTGLAIILVNEQGENQIVLAPGANTDIRADQVPDEILGPTNLLLMQGETPAAENWALLERAKARGAITMLNLAPVIPLPQAALRWLDYLVVNQVEARQIAAALKLDLDEDAAKLAHVLARQGPTCIVTLGPHGSVAVAPNGLTTRVGALPVTAIDTTGAGDAYCGTLAAALHQRIKLSEAMKLASVAGSLACTKLGAQDSYAYQGDIEARVAELGEAVISH